MNKFPVRAQLLQLVTAQFKEVMREPAVLFWGIIFPILMSLGLGIAFTKKTDTVITVAIIQPVRENDDTSDDAMTFITRYLPQSIDTISADADQPRSYKLVDENEQLGNTIFLFKEMTWDEGMVQLKRGNLDVLIEKSIEGIRYHFDPLNPAAQLTYLKLSGLIKGKAVEERSANAAIAPLTVRGSRYIDFLIPGLIAMGIMMSCMWGISYGIIEKRSQKLLRRMVATPMKKSYFLIAMISVRIIMNFIESALLFIVAAITFNITIQGSIPALLLFFFGGNIAFAGIAVFASSHTARTEVGNGMINAIVMPMMVLSGIFFSYHNFPDWAVSIIRFLPLTMLTDGIRSIFIEGAGYAETSLPFIILTSTGVIFFGIGLKIFKWH